MIYKIQIYFKHITEFIELLTLFSPTTTDTQSSTTVTWWSKNYFDVERVLYIKKFWKPMISDHKTIEEI